MTMPSTKRTSADSLNRAATESTREHGQLARQHRMLSRQHRQLSPMHGEPTRMAPVEVHLMTKAAALDPTDAQGVTSVIGSQTDLHRDYSFNTSIEHIPSTVCCGGSCEATPVGSCDPPLLYGFQINVGSQSRYRGLKTRHNDNNEHMPSPVDISRIAGWHCNGSSGFVTNIRASGTSEPMKPVRFRQCSASDGKHFKVKKALPGATWLVPLCAFLPHEIEGAPGGRINTSNRVSIQADFWTDETTEPENGNCRSAGTGLRTPGPARPALAQLNLPVRLPMSQISENRRELEGSVLQMTQGERL